MLLALVVVAPATQARADQPRIAEIRIRGADADQPYTVERVPEGGRVTVHIRPVGTRFSITPGGPGVAELKNKVDGFAPWAGVEAEIHDTTSYNNANLYVRGSYGFASKDA